MTQSIDNRLTDLTETPRSLTLRPGQQSFSDNLAVVGMILQQPKQFFKEIREGVGLLSKIGALTLTSTLFLAAYGAVLGVGHPYLSWGAALALPLLFMGSLATCVPVMYLLDVLTGSQRSLGQTTTVILTSTCSAATVFFSFAPIMLLFRLTGTILQYFWLNLGILTLATLVGLTYVTQGLIETAIVDPHHNLRKLNQRLHFLWMLIYVMVITQMAWGMLSFFERTGGFLAIWLF